MNYETVYSSNAAGALTKQKVLPQFGKGGRVYCMGDPVNGYRINAPFMVIPFMFQQVQAVTPLSVTVTPDSGLLKHHGYDTDYSAGKPNQFIAFVKNWDMMTSAPLPAPLTYGTTEHHGHPIATFWDAFGMKAIYEAVIAELSDAELWLLFHNKATLTIDAEQKHIWLRTNSLDAGGYVGTAYDEEVATVEATFVGTFTSLFAGMTGPLAPALKLDHTPGTSVTRDVAYRGGQVATVAAAAFAGKQLWNML